MIRTREKYNAKARRSSAGLSKKKSKGPHTVENDPSEDLDTNAVIHIPMTKERKELERQERLRRELAAQPESKMSRLRKKRFEKYIEKKMKQEERMVILKKLEESQAQISSVYLQSSSTLGTGKSSTRKQQLEKLEDKEVRRAIGRRTGKRKRAGDDIAIVKESDDDSDVSSNLSIGSNQRLHVGSAQPESPSVIGSENVSQPATSKAPGSALRRDADGSVDVPKVVKRTPKSKHTIFRSWKDVPRLSLHQPAEDSDTSFDSSDSAKDSDHGASDDREDSGSDSETGKEVGANDRHACESSAPKAKLGFKDWARQQLSIAKEYVAPPDCSDPPQPLETTVTQPLTKKRKTNAELSKPRDMRGPLGEELHLPSSSFAKHIQKMSHLSPSSQSIAVSRSPDVQETRMMLPIIAEEQQIMESVLFNPVVIVCGETGSGKTTQVPQFLYEAGYGNPEGDNPGMIGITQPRRVAAMSMASRVAHELSVSSQVAYQVRYDTTASPFTRIKFMTDGVLLRELATDFLLSKYSVIIIDEAHERSMNTDILIGVLSRVLKLREEMWKEGKKGAKPLRLIIMSATLRIADFSENKTLFSSPPPVINVPSRQHPVSVHFSRRTASDYITEAFKKACRIHTRLPPGGVLIFLTGQNEITGVCRKLEAKFGWKALREKQAGRTIQSVEAAAKMDGAPHTLSHNQADVEPEDVETEDVMRHDLAIDVDNDMTEDDVGDALDSDDEQTDEAFNLDFADSLTPMHVVPLYSLLPSSKQMRVFQQPPAGARLVVVATNVAETSLTIPGIRYVVDCGRVKERRYDMSSGIQSFRIAWTSRASAAQRAGRAGRTGPGHCYRLYSSALFEHYFEPFARPEVLRTPIEGVVLQMKSLHIDAVVNFPFPTPPDQTILAKAETTLTHLGALLTPPNPLGGLNRTVGGVITDLGRAMSLFPLSPRFSRMLVSGRVRGCLPYIVSIVASLSVGDPFLHESALENEGGEDEDGNSGEDVDDKLSHIHSPAAKIKEANRIRRRAFFRSQHVHASLGSHTSDMFRLLSVVGAYEYAGGGHKLCAEHFVRPKAMEEIHKLRRQISDIVQVNFPETDVGFVSNLLPPNEHQLKIIRQAITAGFIDQVAVRKDRADKASSTGVQSATSKAVPYKALGIAEDVFIHPSSVLADRPPPEYIVFNEVVRSNRVWLKGLTVVNPAWLSSLGKPSLCTFSKPVKNASGVMMVIPKFGPDSWELPAVPADTQSS